jgi:hypothetical protein
MRFNFSRECVMKEGLNPAQHTRPFYCVLFYVEMEEKKPRDFKQRQHQLALKFGFHYFY